MWEMRPLWRHQISSILAFLVKQKSGRHSLNKQNVCCDVYLVSTMLFGIACFFALLYQIVWYLWIVVFWSIVIDVRNVTHSHLCLSKGVLQGKVNVWIYNWFSPVQNTLYQITFLRSKSLHYVDYIMLPCNEI